MISVKRMSGLVSKKKLLRHRLSPKHSLFPGEGLYQSDLYRFDRLGSTNDWAKRHVDRFGHGDVLWALEQVAGRGRPGKAWLSHGRDDLTFSIILHLPLLSKSWKNVGQTAALSLADVLLELGFCAELKWPNDVLIEDAKIAGVLVERFLREKKQIVIVGVGWNVNTPLNFLKRIDQSACSLYSLTEKKRFRKPLIRRFLSHFHKHHQLLLSQGFSPLARRWTELLYRKGKRVRVVSGKKVETVLIRDLLETGELEIKEVRTGIVKRLQGGEVLVHRREASITDYSCRNNRE